MTEMTQAGTVPEWTLGWRLQRALAYAEVPVATMAQELGVSRSTVSRWLNENGAPPRAAFIKMWALRTGVDYHWLRYGASPQHGGGIKTPGTRPRAGQRALTVAARVERVAERVVTGAGMAA